MSRPPVVFDEAHLRRVLKNYASYHNQIRTHLSLNKNAPDTVQSCKWHELNLKPPYFAFDDS
jgi:hypothetical protein